MRRTLDTIIYEDEDNDINFWLDSFNKISLKEFINRIIEKKDIQQMNKQELQNEIDKTKQHLANMEKMLAECEYERWKPVTNQLYWYVNSRGKCDCSHFYLTDIYDIDRCENFNCFQTREQAEAEAEKILIRRQLEDIARRLNKGEKIDWENKKIQKYLIYYFPAEDRILLDGIYVFKQEGTIYCLDENFKDVAIQEIGEERLKKYLRGE